MFRVSMQRVRLPVAPRYLLPFLEGFTPAQPKSGPSQIMGFKYFGTAAIGLAVSFIALAAIAVLFNGPDATLADEGAIAGFVALSAGVMALFLAQLLRRRGERAGSAGAAPLPFERNQLDYTIVIPIYNRPELLVALHRRIEELLPAWQSCGRGEIVVVDDGSTDATPVVARQLSERSTLPMRVISQQNKGVSGARNRGFWEARGTVGLVIDSDCLPDPQWLPTMLAAVNAAPKTLAFANVYSERKVQYPFEASPSGAPFVGASFAMRADDYVAVGGNCELFSGASRDDGDFYLTAKESGCHVAVVAEARVWHPIRQQSNGAIFRAGIEHRYDNLLAQRHGDRALFYLGDWLLGGSFAGHYPFTIVSYSFVILFAYEIIAALFQQRAPAIVELLQLLIVLAIVWAVAQLVFMRALGIGWSRFWKFVPASLAHATGAGLGRLRGTFERRFVLL